jgi:hypothetical protein
VVANSEVTVLEVRAAHTAGITRRNRRSKQDHMLARCARIHEADEIAYADITEQVTLSGVC